jgi:hypothetical protein
LGIIRNRIKILRVQLTENFFDVGVDDAVSIAVVPGFSDKSSDPGVLRRIEHQQK